MRRALVLFCLFFFTALPQAYAVMAHASPAAWANDLVLGDSAAPAYATGGDCNAEEFDHDPMPPVHAMPRALPFYAIIWQAGPGALSEADVRPAMRPPRVRN